jgi:hypothetical protein
MVPPSQLAGSGPVAGQHEEAAPDIREQGSGRSPVTGFSTGHAILDGAPARPVINRQEVTLRVPRSVSNDDGRAPVNESLTPPAGQRQAFRRHHPS